MEDLKEVVNGNSMVVKPLTSIFVKEGGNELRFIDSDVEENLDGKSNSVVNFMNENDGSGKTEEELDKLYGDCQSLLVDYRNYLTGAKFNFWLNRPQWNLLTDILLNKTEYDSNTLFVGLEISKTLGNYYKSIEKDKFTNDVELKVFKFDATELTYLFHLIKPFKVKGLKREAYLFADILTSISNTSKLINYYDTLVKNISNDIMTWAAKFPVNELELKFNTENLSEGELQSI